MTLLHTTITDAGNEWMEVSPKAELKTNMAVSGNSGNLERDGQQEID